MLERVRKMMECVDGVEMKRRVRLLISFCFCKFA